MFFPITIQRKTYTPYGASVAKLSKPTISFNKNPWLNIKSGYAVQFIMEHRIGGNLVHVEYVPKDIAESPDFKSWMIRLPEKIEFNTIKIKYFDPYDQPSTYLLTAFNIPGIITIYTERFPVKNEDYYILRISKGWLERCRSNAGS